GLTVTFSTIRGCPHFNAALYAPLLCSVYQKSRNGDSKPRCATMVNFSDVASKSRISPLSARVIATAASTISASGGEPPSRTKVEEIFYRLVIVLELTLTRSF